MKKNVKRYISVFNKNNDDFVGVVAFNVTPALEELQVIFNEVNDMYDEFPISKDIEYKLRIFLNKKLDLNEYDYFLSCDLIDDVDTEE